MCGDEGGAARCSRREVKRNKAKPQRQHAPLTQMGLFLRRGGALPGHSSSWIDFGTLDKFWITRTYHPPQADPPPPRPPPAAASNACWSSAELF